MVKKAKKGDRVKVHYTGTFEDGKVFDTSTEREPLNFIIGDGTVVKPIEDTVTGMHAHEKKSVKVTPADAYGTYRKELIVMVDRDKFPPGLDLKVGQQLQVPQPNNKSAIITVLEITDKGVKIDANHPLAGKNLTFEVELLEIV